MHLRPISRFVPAAIFLAAFLLFLILAGGAHERVFVSVWFAGMLAGIAASRGRGTRCIALTTLVSFIAGSVYAAYLIPRLPDQVVRRKVFEALPYIGALLWPCLIMTIVCTGIGFLLGALVRCAVERRRAWFVAMICATVAFVGGLIMVAQLLGPPGPRQLPPPLGVAVDEFPQCRSMIVEPGTTEITNDGQPDYEQFPDVAYGPHGWRNKLDLYLPTAAPQPMPVIVYIHGGGWTACDKTEEGDGFPRPWLLPLLSRGFAIASINYRLTDDYPLHSSGHDEVVGTFPAQIQDCKAAVRFLRANATEYGLDPQSVGVMGHSAGGHLAALVGVANDVSEFEADGRNRDVSSRVQAVAVLAGPVDLRVYLRQIVLHGKCCNFPPAEYNYDDKPGDSVPMLLGGPVAQNMDKAAKASPVSYVSEDDPPILLVYGFRDILVPPHQGEYFHCLLRSVGVDSQLVLIPGAGHVLAKYPASTERIVEFFESRLQR